MSTTTALQPSASAEIATEKPVDPQASSSAPTSANASDHLSGHVGHLDESQQQSLQAFKALLFAQGLYKEDPVPNYDEATLLRFLRARRWDKQAALKQLKEADHWRKTHHVDHTFETHEITSYEEARRCYPSWTGRRTRKGIPYYIYKVAKLDKKIMDKHDSKHSNGKKSPPTIISLYESLLQNILPMASKLEDRPNPETPLTASVNIVDISNVSLMQFFSLRGHLGDASALATARYPETLDSILVIGAPPYVETVWSFISKWFDANTRAKISILSNDKDATFKRMCELIHPDDIPKDYGGNLDWDFADTPNLDPVIKEAYGLQGKEWPIGPMKVIGDEIIALGTYPDGRPRREVVGTFRSKRASVALEGSALPQV